KQLMGQHEYQEAIRAAQKLRITKVHEKEVKKLILEIKNRWISHEIEANKKLLQSDKYEDALLKAQQIKKLILNQSGFKSSSNQQRKNINIIKSLKNATSFTKVSKKRARSCSSKNL